MAKQSGDKKRIRDWENEAKRTRVANLKQSQTKSKERQANLFDPLAYDNDSPLLRGLYSQRGATVSFAQPLKRRTKNREFSMAETQRLIEFAGGYACGESFIPKRFKCFKGRGKDNPSNFKDYARERAKVYKNAQRGQLPQSDRERKLLVSVQKQQGKIQTNKERAALVAAASAAGAKQVLPSGIADVEVDKLNLDPKRFQYKLVHGASGSSGSLTGVRKWDPNLAGVVQAWRDPKDGKVYVVNGHNRAALAQSMGVKTVTARFLNVKTPEEARAIGALTNVSEGRGTALDSAKFFRDSGLSRADLEKKGIPMREKIADDGLALASLNDGLFNRVVQGDLAQERATVIGSMIKDGKQQSELVSLIEQQEKRGRKITNDTIKELGDMVNSAPKQQEETGGLMGLLGFAPEQRSLALEKAELQSEIKKRLAREKRLFGVVGKSKAASDLKKAGNVIDIEQSREVSESADIAMRVFDAEKNFTGSVSSALNRAAERIADGENSKKVKDDIYEEVLAQIQKTNPTRKRRGAGGGEDRDQRRDIDDEQGQLFAASATLSRIASFSRPLKRRKRRKY